MLIDIPRPLVQFPSVRLLHLCNASQVICPCVTKNDVRLGYLCKISKYIKHPFIKDTIYPHVEEISI